MRLYFRIVVLLGTWLNSANAANTVLRGGAATTSRDDISPHPLEQRELLYSANCATHPACVEAGKEDGDCCPDEMGIFSACCTRECSAYPICVHEGKIGGCCPSLQGHLLSCCFPVDPSESPSMSSSETPSTSPSGTPSVTPSSSSSPTEVEGLQEQGQTENTVERSCSAYKTCADLSLDGNCCENDFGLMLECCKTCESHPLCAAENLADNCCPDAQGKMLACCDFGPRDAPSSKPSSSPSSTPTTSPSSPPTPAATAFDRSCSAFKTCADLRLDGNCCENDQGLMLECCKTCESHPKCAAENLEGNCCPNDQGKMLACCKF